MTKQEELIYLAGIIDGEGHFYKPNTVNGRGEHCRYSRIVIVNTNTSLIEWVKNNFGGSSYLYKRSKPNQQDCWRWTLQGKGAEDLAKAIFPYLIIKKEQVLRIMGTQTTSNKQSLNLCKHGSKLGLCRHGCK